MIKPTPNFTCPQCARTVEIHMCPIHYPVDGDVAICTGCSALNIFRTHLVVPTVDELDDILADPRTAEATAALRELRERKGAGE